MIKNGRALARRNLASTIRSQACQAKAGLSERCLQQVKK